MATAVMKSNEVTTGTKNNSSSNNNKPMDGGGSANGDPAAAAAAAAAATASLVTPRRSSVTESLDVENFDVIAYINERFPDEASLSEVDSFSKRLQQRIGTLDDELTMSVRAQAQLSNKALDDLEAAKRTIKELHSKVKSIRSKTQDSESKVEAVCRDITKLDRAKSNLSATMTASKTVSSLLTMLDKLETTSELRQYGEAAKVLAVVNDLNSRISAEDNVGKIKEMKSSIARVKDQLTKHIYEDIGSLCGVEDFDYVALGGDVGELYTDQRTPEKLKGACAVADLLSISVQKSIRKTLISSYLKPYDAVFRVGGSEDAGMDRAERRYAWLRRLFDANHKVFSNIFPASWRMEEHIVASFAVKTVEHFKYLLEQQSQPVQTMVKALKKTMDFEADVQEKFIDERKNENEVIDEDKKAPEVKTHYAEDLPQSWLGVISSVFHPHMGSFVFYLSDTVREQVDNAMVEELVEISKREKDLSNVPYLQLIQSVATAPRVYDSSTVLFRSIKNTMEIMIEFSNEKPFFDLLLEHQKRLLAYAEALEKRAQIAEISANPQAKKMIPPSVSAPVGGW